MDLPKCSPTGDTVFDCMLLCHNTGMYTCRSGRCYWSWHVTWLVNVLSVCLTDWLTDWLKYCVLANWLIDHMYVYTCLSLYVVRTTCNPCSDLTTNLVYSVYVCFWNPNSNVPILEVLRLTSTVTVVFSEIRSLSFLAVGVLQTRLDCNWLLCLAFLAGKMDRMMLNAREF